MSLQAILERIRAAGDTQVQEIRGQSEREIQSILVEAQAEAEQIYQAAYRQALEPEAGASARILNQARFEAICLLGKARESLVEAALAEVYQQLQEIRLCPNYPAVLRGILSEMLPGGDSVHKMGDRFILEADPRDRELLEGILGESQEIQVEYSLRCWGGLIGRSPDGTVRLVNTLESRLEQALPYIKQQMVARFEQDKTALAEDLPLEKISRP